MAESEGKMILLDSSGNVLNTSSGDTARVAGSIFSRTGDKIITLESSPELMDEIYLAFWDVSSLSVTATGDSVSCSIDGFTFSMHMNLLSDCSDTIFVAHHVRDENAFSQVIVWDQSGNLVRVFDADQYGSGYVLEVGGAVNPYGAGFAIYLDYNDIDGSLARFDSSGILQTSSVLLLSPFNTSMVINMSGNIAVPYYHDISAETASGVAFAAVYSGTSVKFDVKTSGIPDTATSFAWGEIGASKMSNHVIIASDYWNNM